MRFGFLLIVTAAGLYGAWAAGGWLADDYAPAVVTKSPSLARAAPQAVKRPSPGVEPVIPALVAQPLPAATLSPVASPSPDIKVPRQYQALAERLKSRRSFDDVQKFWRFNKWWDKGLQNAMRNALSSPDVDPTLARWSDTVLKDLKAGQVKVDTWRTIVKDADAQTVADLVAAYDEDAGYEQRSGIELAIGLIESEAGLQALGDLVATSDAPYSLRKAAASDLADTHTPATLRLLEQARTKLAALHPPSTSDPGNTRHLDRETREQIGRDWEMIRYIDSVRQQKR